MFSATFVWITSFPVATKYQSVLVDNVSKIFSAFPAEKAKQLSAYNVTLIEKSTLTQHFIVNAVDEYG